jgi:hypothetical protein
MPGHAARCEAGTGNPFLETQPRPIQIRFEPAFPECQRQSLGSELIQMSNRCHVSVATSQHFLHALFTKLHGTVRRLDY